MLIRASSSLLSNYCSDINNSDQRLVVGHCVVGWRHFERELPPVFTATEMGPTGSFLAIAPPLGHSSFCPSSRMGDSPLVERGSKSKLPRSWIT
jgi:hypothetical protein